MYKTLNRLFMVILAVLTLILPAFATSQDKIFIESTEHEHLYHTLNPNTNTYQISSVVTIDETEHPSMCQTFLYDDRGLLIQKSLYGNLSGACKEPIIVDHEGQPIDNGIERFSLHWSYDAAGQVTRQHYSHSPTVLHDLHINKKLAKSALKDKWNSFMETVFGPGFLQFAGYYEGTTSTGVHNHGNDAHDKVRVTLINGILCVASDMDYTVKSLSVAHGDVTVYYVFRPTKGWTRDIWNCAFVKMGFISEPAQHLGNLWKKLIADMGGAKAGGIIQHYAHSIGATDTYNALDLLTEAEKKCIHVVTIGSPTMIPANAGFASVVNYASKRDAICMLDPLGYIRAWTKTDANVIFVGDTFGAPEHTIYTPSYQRVIADLGDQFNKNHR